MRVLVVKLTSMGDVLHLMPALSDLQHRQPGVIVDWMVEDSFSEIPQWHSSVDRVIAVSTRRWRKINHRNFSEFRSFVKELRKESYDIVIDAQGLMKSAVFARFAKLTPAGFFAGFSGGSIKESPAAWFYKKKVEVGRSQHAITRLRQLFSGVCVYPVAESMSAYGLQLPPCPIDNSGVVFLFHGTTWSTKHLPDQTWRDLVDLIEADGFKVKLCWGNELEKKRAVWIAHGNEGAEVLPRSSLTALAVEISTAKGAIAVDTGLGHMSAALGVPTVSVYGSTDSELTGTEGHNQHHLQSDFPCSPCLLKKCDKLTAEVKAPPCYQQLGANRIWATLRDKIIG